MMLQHLLLLLVLALFTQSLIAQNIDNDDLGFDLLMSGVGGEEVFRQSLTVEGNIPRWLNGKLIQNGGGRFEWPTTQRNLTNAGDGYAKLDVFTFTNGSVEYTSKFATTGWFNKSTKIEDIAPSLTFGIPSPERTSDKLGLPNVLAPNDNLAVNIVTIQDRILLLSDRPGSIEFHTDTLEFDTIKSSMPGPFNSFIDEPSIPIGMMGSFGAAHPLWTGSSLDGSGDAYGLLNVQRLTTFDQRHEEVRLFKINASDQSVPPTSTNNPWLTRRTIATLNMSKDEFAPYMHSFFLVGDPTPTHAVLVQHSMNIAMATLIAGLGLKPISAGFDIDLQRPMIFHIINLNNGNVERQIHVNMTNYGSKYNSMIVSHTINGYFGTAAATGAATGAATAAKTKTTTTTLTLDVIGYDFLFFNRFSSNEINNKTARDHGTYSTKRAKTYRFVLDVDQGVPIDVFELLPDSDWEFPIINEQFKGKHYCYSYGYEFRHQKNQTITTTTGTTTGDVGATVRDDGASGMASMAMIKYNMCGEISTSTGKRDGQVFTRPYHYFSEPWFVPRPGSVTEDDESVGKEDDGVVLTLALDGSVGKGVLYVLDAGSLAVLATIKLPVLVNLKTHGRFVWDKIRDKES